MKSDRAFLERPFCWVSSKGNKKSTFKDLRQVHQGRLEYDETPQGAALGLSTHEIQESLIQAHFGEWEIQASVNGKEELASKYKGIL